MSTFKVLLLTFLSFNIFGQDLSIAKEYYDRKEYQKAVDIYEAALKDPKKENIVYPFYIESLYQLKNWDRAEGYLKNKISKEPNQIKYKIDLSKVEELKTGSQEVYTPLISESIRIDRPFDLLAFFFKERKYDLAIKLINQLRVTFNDPNMYATQMARIYHYQNNKAEMLEELLNYSQFTKNIDFIQREIGDNFETNEEQKLIERAIYQRIKKFPNDIILIDLLLWNLLNQEQYDKAFIQAKAIDKRLENNNAKVIYLAQMTFNNGAFSEAQKMFEYVLENNPNPSIQFFAKKWLIQAKEEQLKKSENFDISEIKELIKQYEELIQIDPHSKLATECLKNSANLTAFYLKDYDKAIEILQKAIKQTKGAEMDKLKLNLADIYVLKGEIWEGSLLYSQVEKTQEETDIGELAKLKNAKVFYYSGQFDLAKSILDVLKKATSKVIANDAMKLSLLIEDNSGFDSTDIALNEFSRIELLLFQNQRRSALDSLAILYEKYKSHSLADDILLTKARVEKDLYLPDEALETLDELYKNFSVEVTADEALMLAADIYENYKLMPEKAMNYYSKILKEYPASVYVDEARKNYRKLRDSLVK